ncbi:MAG: permease [Candidatus Methanogranum gryphiswaldense]|nr:MAG: permease [Candidatus Methanogranum sp. U3.2.1]
MALNILFDALNSGLEYVISYLAEHVITCLIPAFFIAGAIAALIKKDSVIKYLGPKVSKYKSYSVASVSGTLLAVCSCTILPLFAGIYKKGAGLGPAITFLFAGPAINVLAIIYTAQVLGFNIGVARAVAAISLSIVVGLIMAFLFKKSEKEKEESIGPDPFSVSDESVPRPKWVIPIFFALLVGILIFGASSLDWMIKLPIVYIFTILIAVILIYYFTRDQVTEWGTETWMLTKKIFPILIIGTFIVGVFAYFVPPETFAPYLGSNSLGSTFLASLIGAVIYMPTLMEVPIIGGVFGYTTGAMASGPALALLLSGPTTSLPSIAVLYKIIGLKKTLTYWILVVIMATIAGMIYGAIT